MSRVNYRIPLYMVILMNILGFLLIFISNDFQVNVLYVGLGFMALFVLVYTVLILCRMGDKFLIMIVSMLTTISILMLCRIELEIGVKQIVWIALGCIVFFIAYVFYYKLRFLDKIWLLYALVGTGLFVMTLVLGKEINGSKNWIEIGGMSFQPSEFTKIIYILFLACYYSKSWETNFLRMSPTLITGLVSYAYIGFLALQRDWGTILVMFMIYMFLMYVYESKRRLLGFNIIMVIVVGILGYLTMNHIRVRVNVWLDPWADPSNTGYQITQGLYGIASGGYFGTGLGNGSLRNIPEIQNDFIFSAICVEMGVFGGAAVILLFFLLSYRCFKITINTTNAFNKVVGLGISVMFSLQTFIIIGGVINLIPLTGITVPFVSSGGSSVVASFAALGIMQAISAVEERKGEDYE